MTNQADIVAQLRSGELCGDCGCRMMVAGSGCTCADAADLIERLQSNPQDWQAGFVAGLEAAARVTNEARGRCGDNSAFSHGYDSALDEATQDIRAIPVPQEPT